MRAEKAPGGDIAQLRSEMTSLRVDVAADTIIGREDMGAMRKELGERIVGPCRRRVPRLVVGHSFRSRMA